MKRHIATFGLAVAFALAGPTTGRAIEQTGEKPDHDFLVEAASGGLMEVELGRIAKTHASNDRVRQFGERMMNDHSKAGAQLKELASRERITLPDTMQEDHRDLVARLSQLRGRDFDRAYMKAMVEDHETDVKKFKEQATSATDPSVRAFAAKTLPTLEAHLRMATDISSATGGHKGGTSATGD